MNDKVVKFNTHALEYSINLIDDVFLGVVLGLFVNIVSNTIRKVLKLSIAGLFIIQTLMNIFVLYQLELHSDLLYRGWFNPGEYGIVFLTVFFATQTNVLRMFMGLHHFSDSVSEKIVKGSSLL